jgi:zinc transporter, ZIP family
MPAALTAAFWGSFAGAALLLGAAVGYRFSLPRPVIAGVMAFGSGVLISALSLELMTDAYERGGALPTMVGFLVGAAIYSLANAALSRRGARHRKRSEGQPSATQADGSGAAIAVGALLDGIPESLAIGLTMLAGGGVGTATVAAIFVSNIPEGLSSAAGMKTAGRSSAFIFGIWLGITVASGLAALAGFAVFGTLSPTVQAGTTALAAGGILAMLAETMMPEAYTGTRDWTGIITCLGFLCASLLTVFSE